jgi:hypothetical protein
MIFAATRNDDDYDWNFTIDDSVGATDPILSGFLLHQDLG